MLLNILQYHLKVWGQNRRRSHIITHNSRAKKQYCFRSPKLHSSSVFPTRRKRNKGLAGMNYRDSRFLCTSYYLHLLGLFPMSLWWNVLPLVRSTFAVWIKLQKSHYLHTKEPKTTHYCVKLHLVFCRASCMFANYNDLQRQGKIVWKVQSHWQKPKRLRPARWNK